MIHARILSGLGLFPSAVRIELLRTVGHNLATLVEEKSVHDISYRVWLIILLFPLIPSNSIMRLRLTVTQEASARICSHMHSRATC